MTQRIPFLLRCVLPIAVVTLGSVGCGVLSASAPTRYIQYPVRPGDTLSSIAKRFDVVTSDLKTINDLDNGDILSVGTYLRVPYKGQSLAMNREDAEFVKVLTSKKQGSTKPLPAGAKASLRRVSIGSTKQYVGKLVMPVDGASVSSPFGRRWMRFHEGVDLRAPEGAKIRAAHDGRVVFVSEHFSGYGKTIVLQGNEFVTVYAHNRKNRVSKGEKVSRGEWIGDVGQTGDATGPHLHFETRVRDSAGEFSAVDPFTFLKPAK